MITGMMFDVGGAFNNVLEMVAGAASAVQLSGQTFEVILDRSLLFPDAPALVNRLCACRLLA